MFLRITGCLAGLIAGLTWVGGLVAEESYVLRYKLEKGATQIIQHTVQTKVTQTVNGANIESDIKQTGVDSRVIDDVASDGTAKFRTKNERLKVKSKIATIDYTFDSQDTVNRDKGNQIAIGLTALYERLSGSELQYELSLRGTVTKFSGFSQLVGDILKEHPVISQFAAGGSDKAGQTTMQGQWIVFPEKAVKPGESWENPFNTDLTGVGAMKGKETVTFVSVEAREGHQIAKLSVTHDLSVDIKLNQNGADVEGKITTSNSTGTAEFDITAGKLLKQTSETTLSGQLMVAVNNMTFQIPITQTLKSEHEALAKIPE